MLKSVERSGGFMPPTLHPEIDRAGEATPHTITQMHAFFCPLALSHTPQSACTDQTLGVAALTSAGRVV